MRRAPCTRGARGLRGRFKEAPGWGRSRAAGGPAGREPSVRREHGGGGLRARAQLGPERAVSGPGGGKQEGVEGRGPRPRPPLPARAGALFRGRRCDRPHPGRALPAERAEGLAVSGLLPSPQAPA